MSLGPRAKSRDMIHKWHKGPFWVADHESHSSPFLPPPLNHNQAIWGSCTRFLSSMFQGMNRRDHCGGVRSFSPRFGWGVFPAGLWTPEGQTGLCLPLYHVPQHVFWAQKGGCSEDICWIKEHILKLPLCFWPCKIVWYKLEGDLFLLSLEVARSKGQPGPQSSSGFIN